MSKGKKKKREKGMDWYPESLLIHSPHPKYWESEAERDEVKCCDLVKKKITLYFTLLVVQKIAFLLNKFTTEWACDLIGEKQEDNFIVEDIYIFEQEASYASVARKESPPPRYIGTLHSHGNMGVFFSDTDKEFPNANHLLSGVVAKGNSSGLPFEARFTARIKTPCGKWIKIDNVEITLLLPKEEFNMEEEEIKKIKTPLFSPISTVNPYSAIWWDDNK